MIFSRRGRAAGRHARDDRSRHDGPAEAPTPRPDGSAGPEAEPAPATQAPPTSPAPRARSADPTTGPYDVSQAPAGVRRLDLGSLQIPSVPGVELRMQASPDGVIQRVALVHGESALQVAAFAAPRSEGIWDEVREEIRASMFSEGVAVEEIEGEYGPELRARMRTPDGLKDLRVVGVDGPRWMVRADFHGPVAVDPSRGQPLVECLRGLVVDRGREARPVREPLPLRLAPELAAQLQRRRAAAAAAAQGDPAAQAGAGGAATGGPAAPGGAATPAPGAAGRAATAVNAARRKPSPRPRRKG